MPETEKKTLSGVCFFYSETGTEGGYWAFQDQRYMLPNGDWSYDGLHILRDGDQLTIYSPVNPSEVIWSGVISLRRHPNFTQHVFGFWIHADQEGVERETWGRWFFDEYQAELTPRLED